MRIHAVDYRMPMTRRGFLQGAGLALVAGFTAIADELAALFRCCTRNRALSCWSIAHPAFGAA